MKKEFYKDQYFVESVIPFILVVLSGVLSLIVAFILFMSFKYTPKIDTDGITFDDPSVRYVIDTLSTDNGTLSLVGWAAQVETDINSFQSYFALYDEQENEYYQLKTKMVVREDVARVLKAETNIKNCGLRSITDLDMLNPDHTYRVCILYENNENHILMHTNKKINGMGELLSE